jgi:DNA-directed RNA polymerase subunit L
MELKVVEKKGKKWKLEVRGESHGFLNLLKEKAWDAKALQASYMVEHPYLAAPKIIVRAGKPKKVLTDAAKLVVNESKLFLREFKKSVK